MPLKFLQANPGAWRIASRSGVDIETITSPNRLTAYYAIALLMIGCVTLLSHLVQGISLESGQGMAATINISGRQRMLSQRIESLAEQYHRGDTTARETLVKSIDEFATIHDQLSGNYISPTGKGSSYQTLHNLYFVGAESVDQEVRTYIQAARTIASLPPNDPAIPALLDQMSAQAREPLLTSLNEVVAVHEKDSEGKLAELKALQWILLTIMGATLALEARLIFRPLVFKIVKLSTYLHHQATVDPLTGVNNRRGFNEQARKEFERFQRQRHPMTVIAVDIDHFKRINDTFGHDAGDAVLKAVVEVLAAQIRPTDVLGRMGGEEFAIILPGTSLEGAVILAERIRQAIAELRVEHQSQTITVTSSFGVTALLFDASTLDTAVSTADKLLYRAKQAGRNCVIWEPAATASN